MRSEVIAGNRCQLHGYKLLETIDPRTGDATYAIVGCGLDGSKPTIETIASSSSMYEMLTYADMHKIMLNGIELSKRRAKGLKDVT